MTRWRLIAQFTLQLPPHRPKNPLRDDLWTVDDCSCPSKWTKMLIADTLTSDRYPRKVIDYYQRSVLVSTQAAAAGAMQMLAIALLCFYHLAVGRSPVYPNNTRRPRNVNVEKKTSLSLNQRANGLAPTTGTVDGGCWWKRWSASNNTSSFSFGPLLRH